MRAAAGPLCRLYRAAGEPAQLLPGIEAWRAQWNEALGARIARPLAWREDVDGEVHGRDLGPAGWIALCLWAVYAERTDLELPDTVPPLLEFDRVYRDQAEAKFERDNAALAQAGKPVRSKDEFEKAWKDAHPVPVTHIDAVLDQIDYAVKLMGVDHVGIGSDFDGVSGNLPVELRSVADYPNLVDGLLKRGHSEADVRKILGGNLLRVWSAVEAGSARPRD